ncbi:unnamed protein product, partial [Adineta steineri]
MFLIYVAYFLLIKSIFVHSELFTSTTHLTHLLNTEIELSKQLETYLKKEYERLDQVEKFLNVIKDEIRQAQGNGDYYFGNPVNAYLFIKHLTVDWYTVEETVSVEISKTMGDNWLFPSFEDYTGSAVGLMRLQDTYKLNTSDIANGEISSNFKSRKLSALECYDLGRIAYTSGDFYHTLMWMQEALDHLNTEPNNTAVNKINILDHLAYATSQQGNVEHALAVTEQILSLDPDHVRARNNKDHYEELIRNKRLTAGDDAPTLDLFPAMDKLDKIDIKNQRPQDYLEERERYEQLCRQNESKLDPKRAAKLFCRYRHNNHPYLLLRPAKEEQLLDQPALYLFHDIISDKDIEEVKRLASPRLQRAIVRDSGSGTFKAAEYRT